MANSHVVSGLIKKRAKEAGILEELLKRTESQRRVVLSLDATIKLFAPDLKPGAIPSIRPYIRRRYFKSREVPRMIRSILREGAHSTEAIVTRLMMEKRLDAQDDMLLQEIHALALETLRRMVRGGSPLKPR